jgi:hypothetical protein
LNTDSVNLRNAYFLSNHETGESNMKRFSKLQTMGLTAVALGLLAFATPIQAGKPWHSVMADSDFVGECVTANAAGTDADTDPGGRSCFGTTQFVPNSANVLRITWSTAGDTHNGAAVRLGCRIRPASTGVWSYCNAFGTGAAPGNYVTKNKLPVPTGITNCDDGGGGAADCHDNSIEMTWCVPIDGDDVFDIDLRIASSDPSGIGIDDAFVEASYFYVDSSKIKGQCGAGDADGTTPF